MTDTEKTLKKNAYDWLGSLNDDIENVKDYIYDEVEGNDEDYDDTVQPVQALLGDLKDSRSDFLKITSDDDKKEDMDDFIDGIKTACHNGNIGLGDDNTPDDLLNEMVSDFSGLYDDVDEVYGKD